MKAKNKLYSVEYPSHEPSIKIETLVIAKNKRKALLLVKDNEMASPMPVDKNAITVKRVKMKMAKVFIEIRTKVPDPAPVVETPEINPERV